MGRAIAVGCAGHPAISVPTGCVHGFPAGVTFAGTAWSEPQLIRFASAFERAHPGPRAASSAFVGFRAGCGESHMGTT
ncbi:hypothetical protein ACQPZG_29620 [Streptomyces sp. CA-294286]|uniref:hypothetical protein n=1 Tax=Streptomyces sp. CA-294286 TaxID=3240070 RepID=UPI003D8D241E